MGDDISARVRAKFPLDEAMLEVWAGQIDCHQCGRECPIIAGFRVFVGGHVSSFNLAELGEFELDNATWLILGPIAKAHRIDWRESKARNGQVLCCSCPACDAILGEQLDIGDWAYRVNLGSVAQPLAMWRRAIFEPGDERERAKAAPARGAPSH